jgi:hypothetical protein
MITYLYVNGEWRIPRVWRDDLDNSILLPFFSNAADVGHGSIAKLLVCWTKGWSLL